MGSADPEDWAAIRAWLDARGGWFALAAGQRVPVGPRWGVLSVVDLGALNLPTGALGACDPFVFLEGCPAWVQLPPGRYPVRLTIADLSAAQDGSDVVEAYVTLLVDPAAEEVRREVLDGGIGVDAGTVAFVDAGSARAAYAGFDGWEALVEGPGGWFARMDDPAHLGPGRANLPLPGVDDGGNVVLCHSGWGDGIYDVVVGYDAQDRVVRVHIDLDVVAAPSPPRAAPPPQRGPTERTRLQALAVMLPGTFAILGLGLARGWPVEVAIGAVLAWTAFSYAVAWRLGWVNEGADRRPGPGAQGRRAPCSPCSPCSPAPSPTPTPTRRRRSASRARSWRPRRASSSTSATPAGCASTTSTRRRRPAR